MSQRLRRQALRDNPNLKDLLTYARAVEKGVSSINAVKNEQRDTKISKTHGKYQQSRFKHSSNIGNHKTTRSSTHQCRNCGGIFPHTGDCLAKGKECRTCGKSGHFAKVCRSKPNRQDIRQVVPTQ